MIGLDEELEVLKGRVAKAQVACEAALATRRDAQAAFQRALEEIDRAAREGNRIGDLSEARHLRDALQAGDLRERCLEATRAAQISCEKLRAALQALTAVVVSRQT